MYEYMQDRKFLFELDNVKNKIKYLKMVMLSQKMLSLSEEELEACSGGSEVGRITSNISQEFTKSSWFSKSIYTKQRRINRRNGHWWNSSGRNDFSVCRSI